MSGAQARSVALPRRAILIGLLVGTPLSAAFFLLAARNVDARAVWTSLEGADRSALLPALLCVLLLYTIQAYRWRRIARRQADVPTRRMLRYVVAGVACNNAVPGRPGDLLRAHWLHGATGMGRSNALATVVVDRAFDVLALVAALAVTSPFLAHEAAWLRRLDVAAAASAAAILAVLVAAVLYARRRGSHDAVGPSIARRVFTKVTIAVAHSLNRRDAPLVACLSLVAWGLWATAAWFVARALGIELSLAEAVFVTAVVNLGAAIPSSPGFVGTYQWLCVSSLGLLAVGHAEAFAFSVLMHAVWFVPTSVAGLALLALRLPSWVASRVRVADAEPSAA